MAETSGFFNSYQGDRKYYVSFLAKYFSSFVGNGIFFGGNYLKVEPYGGNMDIKVLEGKGFINGYVYFNEDAPKVISLEPAHLTMPRIDIVVLRLNLTEQGRAIKAEIKKGVPANTPTAPVLQRDNAVWELKLAEIRVNANVSVIYAANITDYRLNSTSCGVVTNFVPNGFTLDNIFNQYQTELNQRIAKWNTTETQQGTSWQSQMTSQQSTFNTKKSEIEAWFTNMSADISKLQTFDFDNLAGVTGCTRVTTQQSNGYTEVIKNTSNNKKVAERVTTKTSSGYTEVVRVYASDGVTVSKTFTVTTTKTSTGYQERVV